MYSGKKGLLYGMVLVFVGICLLLLGFFFVVVVVVVAF